jgi:hypothetical protein
MMAQLKKGLLQGAWFFPFDFLELAFVAEEPAGFSRTPLRKSAAKHADQESSAYMLIGNDFVERMDEV